MHILRDWKNVLSKCCTINCLDVSVIWHLKCSPEKKPLVCSTADFLRGVQNSKDITFLQWLDKSWDHLKQYWGKTSILLLAMKMLWIICSSYPPLCKFVQKCFQTMTKVSLEQRWVYKTTIVSGNSTNICLSWNRLLIFLKIHIY